MKSIKQQYIDLQEGKMSQSNFMRNVRMTLPQFITNVTSYNDTVRILKNKGIITEADKYAPSNYQEDADYSEPNEPFGMAEAEDETEDDEMAAILKQLEDEEDAKHTAPNIRALSEAKTKWENTSGKAMYDQFREIDNMNSYEVMLGINFEMEKNHELTKKEATKIVIRNLKKNPNYYTATYASGVEGYEIPSMSANPEAWQMKYLTKDNLVDKEMGMKPVKNVAKSKASANKAKKETNKAKDIDVLSLVAQTLRGVDKMQSQGEKMKTIKLRETIQRLVKEVMEEKEQKFDNYDEWLDALYKTHPFIKGNEDKYFRKDEYFTNVSKGLESFGYWYNGKAKDPVAVGRVYAPYDVSSQVYPQGSRKD
jgi:flavodoxin